MKFKDYPFNSDLKKVLEEKDFKRPTDIQFKTIQPILDGEDVFAVAPTGTGKTAAFILPIVHRLLQQKQTVKNPFCIVLVPTRELAEQIQEVANEFLTYSDYKALSLVGGVSYEKQLADLKSKGVILVATPGRVFDLVHQEKLNLSEIQFLVLDEADRMLDLGFEKDAIAIHKMTRKTSRQTLFFSATIDKKVKRLAYELVKDAIRIQISPRNPISKNIDHAYIKVEMDDKRFFLENMIQEYPDFKFIVFVRTKVRAERVVAAMERVGVEATFLHGGIVQEERFEIFRKMKDGTIKVLITTDVAARGIDIPNVEMVINYDLPEDPEQYVHRIGRTGRGTNRGQAISFCSPSEQSLLNSIEEYVGEDLEELPISPNDYQTILFDSEDTTYDWKKLLEDDNEFFGTSEKW